MVTSSLNKVRMESCLVDADTLAYRAAFASQDDDFDSCVENLNAQVYWIAEETFPCKQEYYLTGKGNFRYSVERVLKYKQQRKAIEKPKHLNDIRRYLIDLGATVSEDEEADDLIAIRATELGPETVIASVDKDFLQVPSFNYNPGKNFWSKVTEFGGLKFFYRQLLEGDRADNVTGVYRVGPKKAQDALSGCTTEEEMLKVCMDMYEGDYETLLENGRLLWLRRFPGQMWEPYAKTRIN